MVFNKSKSSKNDETIVLVNLEIFETLLIKVYCNKFYCIPKNRKVHILKDRKFVNKLVINYQVLPRSKSDFLNEDILFIEIIIFQVSYYNTLDSRYVYRQDQISLRKDRVVGKLPNQPIKIHLNPPKSNGTSFSIQNTKANQSYDR